MQVVLPSKECVLSQICCLFCHQIPHDPSSIVYLCNSGHLYCLVCYTSGSFKGKKCRVTGCQESLKKTVEPMLLDIYLNSSFRCDYLMCNQVILGGNLKSHHATCHYAPIECPVCKVIVQFQDYLEHLWREHKVEIHTLYPDDTIQNIFIKFPPVESHGQSLSHFHNFRGERFFIHFMIKPKDVIVWIQYYGDVWRERDFVAVVSIANSFGHRTEVTVPINPITVTFKNILKTQNYAHFTKDSLRFYFMEPQPQQQSQYSQGSVSGSYGHESLPLSRRTSQLSVRSTSEFNIHKLDHHLGSSMSSNSSMDGNLPSAGMLPFRVTFSYDYLKIFNAHLYYERNSGGFGVESEC